VQAFEQFESEFGQWAGVPNVVACASGTAALHLALEALQLPLGSEVLVPDYTMIACPRAVVMAGLVPVFVDCGDDLLIDMLRVEEACHEGRKRGATPAAVMAVHIYGRRCLMDWLAAIADDESLRVVEDLAEAHGVKPHPETDAACWSFFGNKIVAGQEGGAVSFRDPKRATLARSLRCLGFTPEHDYTHIPRGHNYRLSNAHAELIRESLAVADANIFLRRQIEAMYEAHCPREWRQPERAVPWVYDLRIRGMDGEQQRQVVRSLQDAGVAARFGFKPMSQQEEFRSCRVIGNGNAARLASEVIYLPVVPGRTTNADVQLAFEIIAETVGSVAPCGSPV
jgi:perosamine synthetase